MTRVYRPFARQLMNDVCTLLHFLSSRLARLSLFIRFGLGAGHIDKLVIAEDHEG